MKAKYLTVYDYGTGGVWAIIAAPSRNDIAAKYPMLKVFDDPPGWMSQSQYTEILLTSSFDLDDEPPNWLKAAMKE
jgi:hypothetical protein